MKIKLNTIKDANDFVSISSQYHDADITVKQNKYIINGKSILGIFSLNILEPVKAVIDSENDNDKIAFYNAIQQWKIE